MRQSTPKNSAKEWSRVVEVLTWSDAAALPRVLDVLLDTDVRLLACSADKLAYRLRVVGGALRRCDAPDAAHLGLCRDVLALVSSEALVHHADKEVRKAGCKVRRDLLQGKASFYVRAETFARDATPSALPLGHPNRVDRVHVAWHEPAPASLGLAAEVLRATVDAPCAEVLATVDGLLGGTASGTGTEGGLTNVSVKRSEERVVALLRGVLKALRGAAEVLPDAAVEGAGETRLLATGSAVLDAAETSVREYLCSVRPSVLRFLHSLQTKLSGLALSSSAPSIDAEGAVVLGAPGVLMFASSVDLHRAWMKVFASLVTVRMAACEEPALLKKSFEYERKMTGSSLSKNMLKYGKRYGRDETGVEEEGLAVFWEGHDLSLQSLCSGVGLQYAERLRVLSFESTRASVSSSGAPHPLAQCLQDLVQLCQHEHEAIRAHSLKHFDSVASRFGSQLNGVIKPLLQSLSDPGTPYCAGAGVLALLQLKRVLKRATGQWDLLQGLLTHLSRAHLMIGAVPEQDRREKLMGGVAGVVAHYCAHWHQLPVEDVAGAQRLVGFVLECNGYDLEGTVLPPADSAAGRVGLRMETWAAYLCVQLVGGDYPGARVPGVWRFCLQSLKTLVGQPAQLIALAGLTKLSHMGVRAQQQGVGLSVGVREQVQACLQGPQGWRDLLQGLSACQPRPRGDEDVAAQWAGGIDSMLSSADYQRAVLPRSDCSELDSCHFSSLFRKENAAMIGNLLTLAYPQGGVAALTGVLGASRELGSISEAEAKAHIVTRAELFAGAYR